MEVGSNFLSSPKEVQSCASFQMSIKNKLGLMLYLINFLLVIGVN